MSPRKLYGDSFLLNYKDILRGNFDKCHNNPSVKMNAEMLQKPFKQKFPNMFSIHGKTKIKKNIKAALSKLKKKKKRKQILP